MLSCLSYLILTEVSIRIGKSERERTFCSVLFCHILLHYTLCCSVLFDSVWLYCTELCSVLFCAILFVLFYSILFLYPVLFRSLRIFLQILSPLLRTAAY